MDADQRRTIIGLVVVTVGIVALLVAYVIAVNRFPNVQDVTAAVGTVSGTIGSLVGAFFGFHAGAGGKDKAEQQRANAEAKVERLAGFLPKEDFMKAMAITS